MSKRFPPILTDESTDARLTRALREKGYEVISVQERMPGITDEEVICFAQEGNCYIITEDKDFGELLVLRKKEHRGALLLRLSGEEIREKIRLLLSVLEEKPSKLLHSFSVLSKNKLRSRFS